MFLFLSNMKIYKTRIDHELSISFDGHKLNAVLDGHLSLLLLRSIKWTEFSSIYSRQLLVLRSNSVFKPAFLYRIISNGEYYQHLRPKHRRLCQLLGVLVNSRSLQAIIPPTVKHALFFLLLFFACQNKQHFTSITFMIIYITLCIPFIDIYKSLTCMIVIH